MAKRQAEPLVCHVPWKRFLPEPPPLLRAPGRRPRDGPELWSPLRAVPGGPGKKRKLEEAEAPPGKRPGLQGNKPGGESGDPASPGGTTRQQRGGGVGPRAEQALRAGGVGLGARSPDPRGEERGTEELQIDQTYTLLKRWSILITELLGYSTPLTCLFGVQNTDNSIIEKQCLHGVAAKSLVAPYRLTDVLHASNEHKEEFWQYNSFQYWRAPLPAIDLSVILDLDGENMTDARTTSRTEIIETEMET